MIFPTQGSTFFSTDVFRYILYIH